MYVCVRWHPCKTFFLSISLSSSLTLSRTVYLSLARSLLFFRLLTLVVTVVVSVSYSSPPFPLPLPLCVCARVCVCVCFAHSLARSLNFDLAVTFSSRSYCCSLCPAQKARYFFRSLSEKRTMKMGLLSKRDSRTLMMNDVCMTCDDACLCSNGIT